MGSGLSPAMRRLLDDRKIQRIRADRKLVSKELDASKTDLKDAEESLKFDKHKWATIQAYYSMFHAARALVFHKGYREKSHHALLVALGELYSNEIEASLVQEFEHAMLLRQEADYGLKFSDSGAQAVMESAERFLARAKTLLKSK